MAERLREDARWTYGAPPVSNANYAWLEHILWHLAPNGTANRRAHEVPLSNPVLTILKAQPKRDGRQFVFGDGPRGTESEKQGGFQGWSKAKVALDKRTSAVPAWRLQIFAGQLLLAWHGVQPHVIEAVLNHASGHKSGIGGVYNRAAYLEQKRAALKLWAKHLVRTVLTGAKNGQ